jgi:hypothetical protein
VTAVFISAPINGRIFLAARSRKGYRRLLWSAVPVAPTAGEIRIKAAEVPRLIRRQAYRVLATTAAHG